MFKQQGPSGEQTTCLVHDKLTGMKANLQGWHVLPLFNSLKAGMELSKTFCTGHGISQKSQPDHLWPQTYFPNMSVLQRFEISPTSCTLNLRSPHQCPQLGYTNTSLIQIFKHIQNKTSLQCLKGGKNISIFLLLKNNTYKTSAFRYYENILDERLPSSEKSTNSSLGAAVKAVKNKCRKYRKCCRWNSKVASAFTHANAIMLQPSVSHLTLDLLLDATAAEDVRNRPFPRNCQFRTKCLLSTYLSGQDFPLGPGFWNKLIFYNEKLVSLGVCLPACGNRRRKEGVLCEMAGPCVRLDAESMRSLDIYAVNKMIWLVQGSAKRILEKPLQASSKQKFFKDPENKTDK